MNAHQPPIRSLILLGGDSSRMGSPKYLLPIPSTVSETGCETPVLIHMLYLHHIFQVKHGDPLLRTVTLSVSNDAQRNEIKDLLQKYEAEMPSDLSISYVRDSQAGSGPASGLTAAWRLDPHAHWLVTGCNHPLISKAALEALRMEHHKSRRAVTCFLTPEDHDESFLALWTTEALMRLSEAAEHSDNFQPRTVLKLLETEDNKESTREDDDKEYTIGVARTKPADDYWITNVDIPEDWARVEKYLKEQFAQSER